MIFQNAKKMLDSAGKTGPLPVYFLYGEDGDGVRRAGQALWGLADGPFPDMNMTVFDGRASAPVDAIAEAAGSLPFMAERRWVMADDLNPEKLDKDGAEKLWQLLGQLIPETTLIITWRNDPPADILKSSRGKKLLNLCDGAGGACAFRKPGRADAAKLIGRRASAAGAGISDRAAGLLAEFCGMDSALMESETDKLCARVGQGGSIDEALVRDMVRPVSEARVFDLADRLLAGDLNAAMNAIDALIYQREDPVTLISMLTMSFSDSYRASIAAEAGVPRGEAMKALGYTSSYRFSRGADNCRRFRGDALPRILGILAEADRRAKSTGADGRAILESAVIGIYRMSGKAR